MENNKKTRRGFNSTLQDKLNDLSPEELSSIDNRLLVSYNLKRVMDLNQISKSRLADLMGKHPSEITKWLSGVHNFTIDILSSISVCLKTNISSFFKEVDFVEKPVMTVLVSNILSQASREAIEIDLSKDNPLTSNFNFSLKANGTKAEC